MIVGIDFPPISHAIEWPDLFGTDGPFAINKVVLLMWLAAIIVFAVFFFAGRRQQLVPTGVQNVGESIVDFIREGIILQTMGADGLPWTPFLLTVFSFVFVGNVFEIIPLIQMPVNARIAVPLILAVTVWVLYHFVGIKRQGFFSYFKSACVPPGVPKPILPLVFLIEFVGIMITRPLSLSVRLFANMLAGHLLLISFAVITTAVFTLDLVAIIWPFSLGMLIALTGFELLVSALQAYIITILTAVYIGGAMHPEH